MNPLSWESSSGTASSNTNLINPLDLDTGDHHSTSTSDPHPRPLGYDAAAAIAPPCHYNAGIGIGHNHFYPRLHAYVDHHDFQSTANVNAPSSSSTTTTATTIATTTTLPRLAQSDSSVRFSNLAGFTSEPNYYTTSTNVDRFSAGSSSSGPPRFNPPHLHDASYDHGTPSHRALQLPCSPYRIAEASSSNNNSSTNSNTRGPTEHPRQFISRNDNPSRYHHTQALARWDMPFLDQARSSTSAQTGIGSSAQTTYQWIDPVISDQLPPASLRGQRTYLPQSPPPSHKGASAASTTSQAITHLSSPTPLDTTRPRPTMAIQTKPTSMSTPPSQSNAGIPATPAAVANTLSSNEPVQVQTQADQDNSKSRKKHGCWMCHKSFDRPSTLRKHLLVHTGEKAFVCDICGRRFGVNSNLNRHVKRCVLRNPPGTSSTSAAQAPPTRGSGPLTTSLPATTRLSTPGPSHKQPPRPSSIATGKRKATSSPGSASSSARTPTQAQVQVQTPSSAKRRRRPPSPVQWIPASLAGFNLFCIEGTKSVPVPLPPVSPLRDPRTNEEIEERDSWDENVGPQPYYKDWKGRLPGPAVGFGGKDVRNLGFPLGSGGFVMGRLVLS